MPRRRLIWIQGQQQWCIASSQALVGALPGCVGELVCYGLDKIYYAGKTIKLIEKTKKHSEIENHLGEENSILIFNCFAGFNPDLFCALTGLIKSPGLVILLSPESRDWPDYNDPDYSRFCSYPYTPEIVSGRFIAYLISKLNEIDKHHLLTIKQAETDKSLLNSIKTNIYNKFKESTRDYEQKLTPTDEQSKAVLAIKELVNKQQNTVLVIYANRGRGKSTSIGLALADCLSAENRFLTVSIVSQNKANVVPVMEQLQNHTGLCNGTIKFFPPDEYLTKRVNSDLVVIDEAATIPLSVLKRLVTADNKTVISTTIDGYEGSGMGFIVKFQQYLAELKIPVNTIELKTPCRWSQNDPVEAFIFSTFFPQKDGQQTIAVKTTELDQLIIRQLNRNELAKDVTKIRQLFGLLAQAHYRTTPDDLRYIFDAPDIEIWTAELDNHLLAAMIVANEGLIDNEYLEPIWLGQRRLNGHLIPQTLSSQCGFKQAIQFSYQRIVRIATSAPVRRRGIASMMVEKLKQATHQQTINQPDTKPDFLAVSYGLETALFEFWEKLGFRPVRLSHRENASSGLRSMMMLKPLTSTAIDLGEAIERQFQLDVLHNIDFPDQKLASHISRQNQVQAPVDWNQNRLDIYSFAFGHRQYLNCQRVLSLYASYCLNAAAIRKLLTQSQINILTYKVLQNNSWSDTARLARLSGKAELTKTLRVVYAVLYQAVWGNKS